MSNKKGVLIDRTGFKKYNYQGYMMEIVEYNNANDIIVEFYNDYKTRIHTTYQHYKDGNVKNPYHPNVFNIGIVGTKYPITRNGKTTKEYQTWSTMLERCFCEKESKRYQTYKDVTCCDEWLSYENFYEWLHSQNNFDKWLLMSKGAIDKDIIVKRNKEYNPNACCLVSQDVNALFLKNDANRGSYPVGVSYNIAVKKYCARISKIRNNKRYREFIGYYDTPEQAFLAYKTAKESYIKRIAQEEYNKGNIIKRCYDAMMVYEVEITD